jgi:GWxTD domain-containing protein
MNSTISRMKISLLFFFLAFIAILGAQDLGMSVDLVRFPAENEGTKFDFNFFIPYGSLTFKPNNDLFLAEVILEMSVNKQDSLVYNELFTYKIAVSSEPSTHSLEKGYLDKISKDDFNLGLDFLDTSSGFSYLWEKDLTLLDRLPAPVGDLEISSMVVPAQSNFLQKFQREGYIYKVEPTHLIDMSLNEDFYVYFEADETILSQKLMLIALKDEFEVSEWKLDKRENSAYRLPLGKLKEGYYDLELRTRKGVVLSRGFVVLMNQKRDIHNVFPSVDSEYTLLKYFTSGSKLKRWRKLASDDARRQFATKFWYEKATEWGMPIEDVIETINERVDASDSFTYKFKAGWLTDRGRIYILHGAPDEIINGETSAENTTFVRKNYEIWKYENNNRASYLFLDIQMNVNYKIIHAVNDSNEPSDSNWKDYMGTEFDESEMD